ncbi:uncharacterized protein LOC122086086 isoform X2 [Macadamia integrifolia]|uniref:uncharacterized protein LOC122086086 isoform X2 n=1 Tax=Macadamia integrifolia TaxID=60698 RepID=UPI001C4F823B|nr:uncharacterized protein LOC122086086 isoform X2 [Macadamia integrifolia]
MGTEPELSSWTDLLHSSTKLLEEVASSAHFPPLQRNLDQLEELSKKLEARTLRTEAHTESIAATRLLAREGIKVEQLPQDLKSFELKTTFEDVFPAEATSDEEYLQQRARSPPPVGENIQEQWEPAQCDNRSPPTEMEGISDEDESSRALWYRGTLLRDTTSHLCNQAWSGKTPVHFKKYGSCKLVKEWYDSLCGAVKKRIRDAGFEDFAQLATRSSDHTLLQALVERWWPTTHTFHLPFGEMSITPMCFYMFTGLGFGGKPITRHPDLWKYNPDAIEVMIGRHPDKDRVLVSWFRTIWEGRPVSDGSYKAVHDQQARCFIMYMLGNTLFSNSSNRISMSMLAYLEDLSRTSEFDWGSAGYAYLLRNLDLLALAQTQCVMGAWFVPECWCYELLGLRAPKLKDCTTLVFPRACRWSSTNTWRHSEVNSVEKIRDMINRLSQNEINWHPWANIEVGNLRRLEIAKKLVQKRVLFCGPSGYAWYLGERAYRQWPGIELPCIPERPPRLMLEPERLSSHDIQRALRGIDAKLFVNRETWGNYCEFMTKQLVCVALTSSGLQTCLHCDPSSPTHPPMSSSAHPLSSKETDPNSNAGTSSGLKIPPMNVHLPGYPGWSFWDGRIERHIPCPDTVYGVPMTYDYIPGHRYDDLMRMVFGLRLLQIHSSNRITVLELENASYRKKIKELKLGSVEEGSEVEGNEEENSD